MSAVRFSFLIASLVALTHGFAALVSDVDWALATRNLVVWELISALFAGAVAMIAWQVFGRRARTLALAIAPTILVGLEISAWMVAQNFHHTLGTVPGANHPGRRRPGDGTGPATHRR